MDFLNILWTYLQGLLWQLIQYVRLHTEIAQTCPLPGKACQDCLGRWCSDSKLPTQLLYLGTKKRQSKAPFGFRNKALLLRNQIWFLLVNQSEGLNFTALVFFNHLDISAREYDLESETMSSMKFQSRSAYWSTGGRRYRSICLSCTNLAKLAKFCEWAMPHNAFSICCCLGNLWPDVQEAIGHHLSHKILHPDRTPSTGIDKFDQAETSLFSTSTAITIEAPIFRIASTGRLSE